MGGFWDNVEIAGRGPDDDDQPITPVRPDEPEDRTPRGHWSERAGSSPVSIGEADLLAAMGVRQPDAPEDDGNAALADELLGPKKPKREPDPMDDMGIQWSSEDDSDARAVGSVFGGDGGKSRPKPKKPGRGKKVIVWGAVVLALGGGGFLAFNAVSGDGDGGDSGDTIIAVDDEPEEPDETIEPEQSWDTEVTEATGLGSHDSPIEAIMGYMNAFYTDRDVDGVFDYLDPNTSYDRGETESTMESSLPEGVTLIPVMSIKQEKEGSFKWIMDAVIEDPEGGIEPSEFRQKIAVVRVKGKWYVSKITPED